MEEPSRCASTGHSEVTRFDERSAVKRVRLRCVTLVAFLAAGFATRASAQDMELPVSLQMSLFAKVATFDRSLRTETTARPVLAVAYQSGYRQSAAARLEVERAITQGSLSLNGVPLVAAFIDLDSETMAAGLARSGALIVYVAPLRGLRITELVSQIREARVLSVTGVVSYVADGIAVGVRLIADRPKIVVNVTAAREAGADLSAELLKLSQVLK